MGRSLHSFKGDRTRLLPPSDPLRQRRQQLMEYRLALSILRLVSQLPWGLKSARLLQDPFAVIGLWVQALVSGLLYSKIQRSRLLTDLGLLRVTKDSSSVLLKDHVLLDPAYTATNRSAVVCGYAP
jgi:hypothetical protein